MKKPDENKRAFLKSIVGITALMGLNPLDVLGNQNLFTSLKWEIDNLKVQVEIRELLRTAVTYKELQSLSSADISKEYTGYLKTLGYTSTPRFQNYSQAKQVRKLSKLDPFNKQKNLTQTEIRGVYKNNGSMVNQAIKGANLGYDIAGLAFAKASCLGTLMSGAPALIPCSIFALGTVFTSHQVYSHLTSKRATSFKKAALESVTISLEQSTYNKFLTSDNFTFKTNLNSELSFDGQLTVENSLPVMEGDSNQELVEFLRIELKKGKLFDSKEELIIFMDQYAEKAGKVQAEILIQNFEATKLSEAQKQTELRETAAFYSSVNNFIGTIAAEVIGPKEAQVMNTIIGAGFQYMLQGSMGPMGWAAVSMNVASILVSDGNDAQKEFQKAMLSALKQIQQQLNIISKKIDSLYANQLEILNLLNEAITIALDTNWRVLNGFNQVREKQDLIYNLIIDQKRDEYYDQYRNITNHLNDILIVEHHPYNAKDVYQSLSNLRNLIVNNLSDIHFTKYSNSSFENNRLKDSVFDRKAKYLVSLYDSIGLIPILADYTTAKSFGQSTSQVVHPIEFYVASHSLTDWGILSKLNKNQLTAISQDLITIGKESVKILNEAASLENINKKIKEYEECLYQLTRDIYNELTVLYNAEFKNRNSTLAAISLNTGQSYPKFRAGFAVKDIYLNNDSGLLKFYDNVNDFANFQEWIDLGFIDKNLQLRTDQKKIKVFRKKANVGRIIAKKDVTIRFKKIVLDAKKGITLSPFNFDYHANLEITERKKFWGKIKMITGVKRNTNFVKNWKHNFRNAYKNQTNKSIDEIIPGFGKMSYKAFFDYLIDQFILDKKIKFINQLNRKIIDPSNLNGIGTSLMVLSKLNKVITSESIIPYTIEYFEEVYRTEDIKKALYDLTVSSLMDEHPKLYNELQKLTNRRILKDMNKKARFSAFNWIDAICLLIIHRVDLTANRSLNGCAKIEKTHAEPHLEQAINRLHWFQTDFLNLRS